jgi:hypothetical protein
VQAKIARVVFRHHYRLPEGVERLEKRGIKCEQLVKQMEKVPCICNPKSEKCRNPLCYAVDP